jgi:hypothetical protein
MECGNCRDFASNLQKANSHMQCGPHAVPPPCLAAPLPFSGSAVSFVKVRVVAGNIRTASPTLQRVCMLLITTFLELLFDRPVACGCWATSILLTRSRMARVQIKFEVSSLQHSECRDWDWTVRGLRLGRVNNCSRKHPDRLWAPA